MMHKISAAPVITKFFCAVVYAGGVFVGTLWYISKKIAHMED